MNVKKNRVKISVNFHELKIVTGMSFRKMADAVDVSWSSFQRFIHAGSIPIRVAVKLECECVQFMYGDEFSIQKPDKINRLLLPMRKQYTNLWITKDECGNKLVPQEAAFLKSNDKVKKGNANELEKMSFLINQYRVNCNWVQVDGLSEEIELHAFKEIAHRAISRRIEESMSS